MVGSFPLASLADRQEEELPGSFRRLSPGRGHGSPAGSLDGAPRCLLPSCLLLHDKHIQDHKETATLRFQQRAEAEGCAQEPTPTPPPKASQRWVGVLWRRGPSGGWGELQHLDWPEGLPKSAELLQEAGGLQREPGIILDMAVWMLHSRTWYIGPAAPGCLYRRC